MFCFYNQSKAPQDLTKAKSFAVRGEDRQIAPVSVGEVLVLLPNKRQSPLDINQLGVK